MLTHSGKSEEFVKAIQEQIDSLKQQQFQLITSRMIQYAALEKRKQADGDINLLVKQVDFVGGGTQIVAGYGVCAASFGSACAAFGAPLLAQGANNMYEEATLHQSGQWVQVSYYFFSVMLLALFLIFKYKNGLVMGFSKVILFIAMLPFIIFHYSVFRFGMAWIYDLVHIIPDDGRLLRISALFFTIGYIFALPIKSSRISRK